MDNLYKKLILKYNYELVFSGTYEYFFINRFAEKCFRAFEI